MSVEVSTYIGTGFRASNEEVAAYVDPTLEDLDTTEEEVRDKISETYPGLVPVKVENTWSGLELGWVFFARSTFDIVQDDADIMDLEEATSEEYYQMGGLIYDMKVSDMFDSVGKKVVTVVY